LCQLRGIWISTTVKKAPKKKVVLQRLHILLKSRGAALALVRGLVEFLIEMFIIYQCSHGSFAAIDLVADLLEVIRALLHVQHRLSCGIENFVCLLHQIGNIQRRYGLDGASLTHIRRVVGSE